MPNLSRSPSSAADPATSGRTLQADYLIVGAGAAGMAFADTLVAETDATIIIGDRHDRPGGHWNDAYPFVRLHQPADRYGVNSLPLASGVKDTTGPNAGLYELASGQEVLTHFDRAMRHHLLPSGRVQYFPMSDVADDGTITSLLSGEQRTVNAGKVVDATYSNVSVPSVVSPTYEVASGASCVPVNRLPFVADGYSGYTVIGAGKTGMDACIWLLEHGADPDDIRWVVPRDSWLLNRAGYQPGAEFLARAVKELADGVEALAGADSVRDVFARLEELGSMRRVDPGVEPEAFHCATVSDGELDQLRRIGDVVRLGRVNRIDADQIVLERGTVRTSPDCLHIDCSARGIPARPAKPVFAGARITLQFVRMCQPAFSAALIAHVEGAFEDEAEKNRICAPIPPPAVPRDWVTMMAVELDNRRAWSKIPHIADWLAGSRLDGISGRLRALQGTEADVIAELTRYLEHVGAAAKNIERILGS